MDWIWYHALPLIVFGVPLIGFLWELLVGLLCRKNCWLLSLPVLAGAIGTGSLSAGTVLPFAVLPAGVLGSLWMCAPLRMEPFPVADHRGSPLEKVDMPGNGAVLRRGAGCRLRRTDLARDAGGHYTMVEEVISEENALSEIPELAITDTDRKILSALEASSSVQAAIGEGDKVTINGLVPAEHADVQKILSEFLEEGQYQFSRSAPSRSSAKSALCTMIFSTGKRASGSLQKS